MKFGFIVFRSKLLATLFWLGSVAFIFFYTFHWFVMQNYSLSLFAMVIGISGLVLMLVVLFLNKSRGAKNKPQDAENIGKSTIDESPAVPAAEFDYKPSGSMKYNNCKLVLVVTNTPVEILKQTITSIINNHGKLTSQDENSFSAVIGAGVANMNPTAVKVAFASKSKNEVELVIIGSALEGLVKQYAGQKAVEMINQDLLSAFPGKVQEKQSV